MEALDGLRLVREGLRLAHAGQALLEVGVDDRDALARQVVLLGRPPAEPHRGEGERHDHAQGDQPELDVDDEQRDADADEGDAATSAESKPLDTSDSNWSTSVVIRVMIRPASSRS